MSDRSKFVATAPATVPEPSQGTLIRAVRELTEALAEERDLDEVLHLIVERLCELVAVRRCSIHLRDGDTELFRGRVGRATSGRIDADVRRLVLGLPADRFTREIVETRSPVLLTNPRADPRAIRSSMREWDVRSVLGVPMVLRDEVVGVVVLDNEEAPHPYAPAQQQLAAAFADLAATAIAQAQLTGRLRRSLQTVERQNTLLKRAAVMEERLTGLLLAGASVRELGHAVATLTGRPCAIYDAGFGLLSLSRPDGDDDVPAPRLLDEEIRAAPVVAEALTALEGARSGLVGPAPGVGLRHRMLVAPVTVRDERWGFVVVVERGGRLGPLDTILARRAAASIALEVGAVRRASGADWQAAEFLAGALIRGDLDAASLEQRADMLGLRLDAPRVLCLVRGRAGREAPLPSARGLAERFTAEDPATRVLTTGLSGDVAVILELPAGGAAKANIAWARERLSRVLDAADPDGTLLAAVSAICRGPQDFGRAQREAGQVMRCAEALVQGEGNHVLAADDLGAGRLFLAAAGGDEARRFVEDSIGPLLRPGSAKMRELLVTLAAFFQTSRNVRRTGTELGVHENTIRYRLARVEELTGLAVADDADAQLTAQLCLMVLRLENRLPVEATPARPA